MSRTYIDPASGQCFYRTRLLTPAHAASFCCCLRANSRFRNASVVNSTSDGKAFVQYQPSSQARYAELYATEYYKREEKGRTEGRCYEFHLHSIAGRPFYLCASTSGETYEVDEHACTCPDFTYRAKRAGLPCKHQVAYFAQVALGEIKSLVDIRNALAQQALAASLLRHGYARANRDRDFA